MFLDSASIRSSAVSIAKQLGYRPRSRTSSYAKIKLTIPNSTQVDAITVPEFTKFTTSFNGTSYSFCNLENVIAKPSVYDSDGNITHYETEEFFIYEGKPKTTSFVNDAIISEQRFIIENTDIDSTTIKVYIKASTDTADIDKELWTPITNITELGSLSKQYSVEESVDGFFELKFGDGIIGKKLDDGKKCGRRKGEKRGTPYCRPSKRISSKTPKTTKEMTSAEKRSRIRQKVKLGQPSKGKPRNVKPLRRKRRKA